MAQLPGCAWAISGAIPDQKGFILETVISCKISRMAIEATGRGIEIPPSISSISTAEKQRNKAWFWKSERLFTGLDEKVFRFLCKFNPHHAWYWTFYNWCISMERRRSSPFLLLVSNTPNLNIPIRFTILHSPSVGLFWQQNFIYESFNGRLWRTLCHYWNDRSGMMLWRMI